MSLCVFNCFAGLKVQVTHLGKQKRKYRVIGVSKEAVSRKTFTKENTDGTKVSVTVAEYFKDQYGITLRLEVFASCC